jgi:hypothetical protein
VFLNECQSILYNKRKKLLTDCRSSDILSLVWGRHLESHLSGSYGSGWYSFRTHPTIVPHRPETNRWYTFLQFLFKLNHSLLFSQPFGLWRYSTFIVLYPIGLISEVGLIFTAMPHMKVSKPEWTEEINQEGACCSSSTGQRVWWHIFATNLQGRSFYICAALTTIYIPGAPPTLFLLPI